MKCGRAEATLHKPSGTVCYHRQTTITFQTGMQERYGNYWKRRGVVWRERTMLQAAFTPYLPPPASYLPASLTYRLAKPRWGSQIICVITFILAKRTWAFVQIFFRPQCRTGIRIKCQNSTDELSVPCKIINKITIIKTCRQWQHKHKGNNFPYWLYAHIKTPRKQLVLLSFNFSEIMWENTRWKLACISKTWNSRVLFWMFILIENVRKINISFALNLLLTFREMLSACCLASS